MIIKVILLNKILNQFLNIKLFYFMEKMKVLKKILKKIKKNFDKFDILNYFQDEIFKNRKYSTSRNFNKSLFEREKIIFLLTS